jgi:hypothetical protein
MTTYEGLIPARCSKTIVRRKKEHTAYRGDINVAGVEY